MPQPHTGLSSVDLGAEACHGLTAFETRPLLRNLPRRDMRCAGEQFIACLKARDGLRYAGAYTRSEQEESHDGRDRRACTHREAA